MKKIIFLVNIFLFSQLSAEENLKFFVKKAIENNLQLNAERQNLEAVRQKKNISRSEFLPSITVSADQTSTTSTNQTDQSGSNLSDSNIDSENKTISIEQKIFSGFKGVNTFKKSELETQKAKLELRQVEQQTILDTAYAYFDLIYKTKTEKFNIFNVDLFENRLNMIMLDYKKGK